MVYGGHDSGLQKSWILGGATKHSMSEIRLAFMTTVSIPQSQSPVVIVAGYLIVSCRQTL